MSASSPKDWSDLLTGHQRPRGLDIINSAAASRGNTAVAHHDFAGLVGQQQFTSLLNQEGVTADDVRQTHFEGEQHHRRVGEANRVIKSSYQSAHDSGAELIRQLDTIADDGNSRIKQIQSSKDPLPIKIGKITDVVMDCQTQANIKAATHCDNVFNEIQKVLDERGVPLSAREFAKNHGIELTGKFGSPKQDAVRQQVEAVLNPSGTPPSSSGQFSAQSYDPNSSPYGGAIQGPQEPATSPPASESPPSSSPYGGAIQQPSQPVTGPPRRTNYSTRLTVRRRDPTTTCANDWHSYSVASRW
ncbi:hypothetical protein [Mycobacterium xenopi]|uniref:Uncharacterized protein n=1 Tax=Mycobacterium xenopi TaxID=1789 RepID=A0AAD1H5I8_MYCXE|nr:hypothetical protein [Mycobacterium xenopi]BBU24776.1 hypothetical protein MYXE_45660 [Mycobacterium xenopi]